MAETPQLETTYEVVCPHCRKTFKGQLMSGGTPRRHGFKCPHCRLFVPFERTADQEPVTRSDDAG